MEKTRLIVGLLLFYSFGFFSQPGWADDPAAAAPTAPAAAADTKVSTVQDGDGVSCSTDGSQNSTDSAGKGNCDSVNGIATAINSYPAITTNSAKIKSEYTNFDKSWKSCISRHDLAANACLDGLSDNLKSVTSALGPIIAAASGASSATGSCSDFSKIMDLANKGLTAYNAACGAAKGFCQSSCQGALDSLSKISSLVSGDSCVTPTGCNIAQIKSTQGQAIINAVNKEKNDKSSTVSSSGKAAMCKDKYAQLMGSAAAGIASMIAGMMQGNKCADATAASTSTTVDCTDASQAQTPTCLCAANPRLAGCALASGSSSNGNGTTMGGGNAANVGSTSAAAPTLNGTPPGLDPSRDPSSASASSLPGGGGGANLGGGSGLGGGAGNGSGDGAGKSGLNTNVLAGTEGGGSGGGSWGGFGSGSDGDGKLKAYLPGGSKDPKMNGSFGNGEVTAQGGQSNWEKVHGRYKDNKPTLLSD